MRSRGAGGSCRRSADYHSAGYRSTRSGGFAAELADEVEAGELAARTVNNALGTTEDLATAAIDDLRFRAWSTGSSHLGSELSRRG